MEPSAPIPQTAPHDPWQPSITPEVEPSVQINQSNPWQPTGSLATAQTVSIPTNDNIKSVRSSTYNNHGNMWITFEHILLFISMYTVATAIGLILHFFINKYFPEIGISEWYGTGAYFLTAEMAALIVAYPIYAFLFIMVQRRTTNNPNIKELKSRKFLIYLTLVITFIIMLYKVIHLVYMFLNGNVGLNFVLHFIITIGITGLIFAYYTYQVSSDRRGYA